MQTSYPTDLPQKFTALSGSYRWKVTMAIFAILLFFALFFSLIAASIYLLWFAISYEMGYVNKWTILLKLGAIAGAAMLVVFVIKFLFKLKNHRPTNRVEIQKDQEPQLWAFIQEICAKTGAPKPIRIYLSPDVNAYVSYSNTWLSLIFPVKKELTIGLPLFMGLNASEFKAVMSHEFGHFAQTSMKVGSYVVTANTIIHDMIYNRDSWDNLMDQWRRSDIRIAVFGWILSGVIFLVRLLMKGFYFLLNVLHSSLSREMEFNADKYAVSTTGSIPIVSGLWKLDGIQEEFDLWMNLAYNAQKKGIYVDNIFNYLNQSLVKLDAAHELKYHQLPDDEHSSKRYFTGSHISKGSMYDSHPPHEQREANAKTPFIHCKIDTFRAIDTLQQTKKWGEQLTKLIYQQYWEIKHEYVPNTETFEAFYEEEVASQEVLKGYGNAFKERYFNIPETAELKTGIANSVAKSIDTLKSELVALMVPVTAFNDQLLHAQHIYNGSAKVNFITVNEKKYNKKNISEGYQKVLEQKEDYLNKAFIDWDKSLLIALAKNAQEQMRLVEFFDRLEQHKQFTSIFKGLNQFKNDMFNELGKLQQKSEVEAGEIRMFSSDQNDRIKALNKTLEELYHSSIQPLPTIESAKDLVEAITPRGKYNFLGNPPFENQNFDHFVRQIDVSLGNWNRIEQLSLSTILQFGV